MTYFSILDMRLIQNQPSDGIWKQENDIKALQWIEAGNDRWKATAYKFQKRNLTLKVWGSGSFERMAMIIFDDGQESQRLLCPSTFKSFSSAMRWAKLAAVEICQTLDIPYPCFQHDLFKDKNHTSINIPGKVWFNGYKVDVCKVGLTTDENPDTRKRFGIRNLKPALCIDFYNPQQGNIDLWIPCENLIAAVRTREDFKRLRYQKPIEDNYLSAVGE